VKTAKKKLYIGNNQVVQVWYKLVQVALSRQSTEVKCVILWEREGGAYPPPRTP